MNRVALLAMLLAPLAPVAARADVTPERAIALQTQIRSWLQSTLGDSVNIKRSPVAVAADGDHFALAYPLAAAAGAPPVTAQMHDIGSGRWSIDNVQIPSPSVFHVPLRPTKTGEPGGEAISTLTLGQQQQQILLDPTFATPTTATSAFADLSLTTQVAGNLQLSHMDKSTNSLVVTPVGNDRVDMSGDSSIQGYTIKMSNPAEPQTTTAVAMAKLSLVSTLTNVSREQGAHLIQLLAQASQNRRADKASGQKNTAANQQTSLALLTALSGLAQSVTVADTADDITVTTQGATGSLKQFAFGLQSKSVDGKLQARMPISADGLTLPDDLGLGGLAQLIPTHLSLTPSLSAVPTGALLQISKSMVDHAPGDQDVAALFSQGPIDAGFDDLRLDVAGSTFAGHVALIVAAPDRVSATGQITAENFDKLQQTMAAEPQTADIAPLVIFLKGIARSEQTRLVWDIAYRDNRLLINGQDMSALMGAAAPRRP